QGKSPFAFGERPYTPTPTVGLAPTVVETCPEGCVLMPDQRPVPLSKRGSRSGIKISLCALCASVVS
ncbi:MAG: hypothetical protein WBH05_11370, partial [Syntrophobacteria bacterium]